jgi:hypothetical protein
MGTSRKKSCIGKKVRGLSVIFYFESYQEG